MLQRPATGEFGEYYGKYIGLVPDGDVRNQLARQIHESISLMSGVSDAKAEKGYGAGKWTLKEVVGHMCDTERVFGYRLLRIARGDETPLPGFEQDDWVPTSGSNARTMASHLLEFSAIRSATLQLMYSLPDDAWARRGTASGLGISARALAYICAGHELHHQVIIRERYLCL